MLKRIVWDSFGSGMSGGVASAAASAASIGPAGEGGAAPTSSG